MRGDIQIERDEAFAELSRRFSFVKRNVLLSKYSTLRVGGIANALAEPATVEDFIDLYQFACKHQIPVFIIGYGSSIIPDDKGFIGLVICTRKIKGVTRYEEASLEVCCGTSFKELVEFSKSCGLIGLEWAVGIPGTVGGGVWMNAGASKKNLSEFIETVSFWDAETIKELNVEDLNWRYRFSSFQEHPEWIILKVVLRLKRATNNEIDQAIDERWAIIRATQPRQFPNVGTVFKENIDALPRLAAGMRVGGMVCSDENPAWIHNTGEGTATDAYRLICKILLRHLVRGLPMPKIEPVFLPYDPNKRISATTIINNPPFIVRFFARVFRFWWRLFNHISFRGN